jgi:hypothetical protein
VLHLEILLEFGFCGVVLMEIGEHFAIEKNSIRKIGNRS